MRPTEHGDDSRLALPGQSLVGTLGKEVRLHHRVVTGSHNTRLDSTNALNRDRMASMRILFLSRDFAGQGSVTYRQLLRFLEDGNELTQRAWVVNPDIFESWASTPQAAEIMSDEDLTTDRFDALILEGGLSVGASRPRVPLDTLKRFVLDGGQVMICGEDAMTARSDRGLLEQIASWTLMMPDYDASGNPRTQYDKAARDPQTGIYSFFPSEMALDGWAKQVAATVERIDAPIAIKLMMQSGDWIATGNTSTKILEADVFVEEGIRFAWAGVQQVGLGHVGIIGANVTHDIVVSENPDNAKWLLTLLTTMKRHTAETKKWRKGSVSSNSQHLPQPMAATAELLSQEESGTLERKASARLSVPDGTDLPALQHAVFKTICAFLNTDGGDLLIGVEDDGTVIGVEREYSTVRGADRDAYERWLTTAVKDNLSGVAFDSFARVTWLQQEGHDVCLVHATKSTEPVFSIDKFFIRRGNQTTELKGSQITEYVKIRF
jgi:hypothetical protein